MCLFPLTSFLTIVYFFHQSLHDDFLSLQFFQQRLSRAIHSSSLQHPAFYIHISSLNVTLPTHHCISGCYGVYIWGGGSGMAIIAAGGTDLYCHSEPPLTSGKLCFIINFIGGPQGGQNFYWGAPPPGLPL